MRKLPRIPINRAVLEWDQSTKKARVYFYGSEDPSEMEYGIGAFDKSYRVSLPRDQLGELVRAAWLAVLRDGLDPESIHVALSDVIEYSELIGSLIKSRKKS